MNVEVDADIQDVINQRVYHRPGVEREYTSRTLDAAETLALLKYHDVFAGLDILDLGVGTGRTTRYLAPLARRYVAIDYSPVMVEQMHRQMPQVATLLRDVRDLSCFGAGEFDFVFGSNCILDALSPADRLRALREIHRVLRPGGAIIFSSHNGCVRPELRTPRIVWSRNPVNSALRVLKWLRQHYNKRRLDRLHRQEADYALYCDEGHDYACLHYYINQRSQRQQLFRLGFEVLDVLSPDGQMLMEQDSAPNSGWLMYVARIRAQANSGSAAAG